jgi:hypothetical protein
MQSLYFDDKRGQDKQMKTTSIVQHLFMPAQDWIYVESWSKLTDKLDKFYWPSINFLEFHIHNVKSDMS